MILDIIIYKSMQTLKCDEDNDVNDNSNDNNNNDDK